VVVEHLIFPLEYHLLIGYPLKREERVMAVEGTPFIGFSLRNAICEGLSYGSSHSSPGEEKFHYRQNKWMYLVS
jgi:hypothetical protein